MSREKNNYYRPPDAQKVYDFMFYKIAVKHGKPMAFVYRNGGWVRSAVSVSDVTKMRDIAKFDDEIEYEDEDEDEDEVVYSPEKPLSCGARVWIETESEVEIINEVVKDV